MLFESLLALLDAGTPCVWVTVARVRGSAPREEGAGMIVTADTAKGTIGGGHLEQKAIELAREWLRLGKATATSRHYPLGPALGQCCGGAVDLLFRPATACERSWIEALARGESTGGEVVLGTRCDGVVPHSRIDGTTRVVTRHRFNPWHVWVFGAGHVGRALAQVFGALPCRFTWVDSRDQEFPRVVADNVTILQADHPQDEVDGIPAGADVLVLTHSHALDLEIVRALMGRDDLRYIGMIGSATKSALFRRRLAERGVARERIGQLHCPIGKAGMNHDKHPGTIAVAVAADLVCRRSATIANVVNEIQQ